MSVTSPAIDLSNALKTIRLAWEDAQTEWTDAVSRDFESNRWDPLENQTMAVIQALDRLAPILARAARDCS